MIVKIKNISIVVLIVFFFPIILLILFIRPFVILRFGNIEYKRIGHLALDTAIYLSLKKKNEYTIDFIGYSKKKYMQ